MPTPITDSETDGIALQITQPARAAGLVEENTDGDPTSLAPVRVYTFNDVLLVVDRAQMDAQAVADLVAVTIQDTKRISQGIDAKLRVTTNGYEVQLPATSTASFAVGDTVVAVPAPNMLVLRKRNWDGTRLVEDLVTMRQEQAEHESSA